MILFIWSVWNLSKQQKTEFNETWIHPIKAMNNNVHVYQWHLTTSTFCNLFNDLQEKIWKIYLCSENSDQLHFVTILVLATCVVALLTEHSRGFSTMTARKHRRWWKPVLSALGLSLVFIWSPTRQFYAFLESFTQWS